MSSPIYSSPRPEFDAAMQEAVAEARRTFKFFWRELYWESRRIVPGLDLACVKVPFSDPPGSRNDDGPEVEHMWINDDVFDGQNVQGTLINSPRWVRSVAEGDHITVPLSMVHDWLYVIGGRAYGGWTVNCMRLRMSDEERLSHDEAWGLDFGDPNQVLVVPDWSKSNPAAEKAGEHPMALNMLKSLEIHLKQHPEDSRSSDDAGWTQLHSFALAGSAASVQMLLAHGADPTAITNSGMTSQQMAEALGWEAVVNLFQNHPARVCLKDGRLGS
ncbi:DUF2314 domain-containing protein [Prosthecobacter sp.]|uniref:DUF2314 domain-containing protein n=1 Tax=Prosthecobacter sp. TaxID=1965333 RepID=UPI002ABA17E2|nr:DUF2314 domain-containing protein [Prosthecobacter sp.]MDZ4402524.1 DUF2314 domain-containing protein [Prosthecobacter sp.]